MKRCGFGRFTLPGRVMLPAMVALALVAAAALTGIFTAQAQGDPPEVANVEIISSPASGTSYGVGENIDVTITFNQQVAVIFGNDEQRPQLKLSIGAIQNRTAHHIDHGPEVGGGDVLLFRYTVTANDHENYGISVIPKLGSDGLIAALSLPDGGRIEGDSGDADLRLREHIITLAYGHRVNAATPEPPARLHAVQRYTSIYLSWEQPGSISPDYYLVERRFHGDPPEGEPDIVVLQRTKSGNRFNFYDTRGLYNGATYEYRVQGFQNNLHHSRISQPTLVTFTWTEECDSNSNTPRSRVKNACKAAPTLAAVAAPTPTPTPAPNAAPRVTAETHNSVTIDWSRMIGDGGTFQVSPTANGFHLSRRASTDVEFTNIAELSLSDTSYQDTGLTPETTYTWRLYEDHPQHRYNLMGEVTHTTSAAPSTTSPPPTPGPTQGNGASAPN